MIAALRSELVKLRRRRVLIVTAVTTLVFSVGSAAIVLASASRTGEPCGQGRDVCLARGRRRGHRGVHDRGLLCGHVPVRRLRRRGRCRVLARHVPDDAPARAAPLATPRREDGRPSPVRRRRPRRCGGRHLGRGQAARALAGRRDRRVDQRRGTRRRSRRLRLGPVLGHRLRGARHDASPSSFVPSLLPWGSGSHGRVRSSTSSRTPGVPPSASSRDSCSRSSSPAERLRSAPPEHSLWSPPTC